MARCRTSPLASPLCPRAFDRHDRDYKSTVLVTNKPITDKQNHGVSSPRNSRNVLVGDPQRIVAIQHPPLTPTKPITNCWWLRLLHKHPSARQPIPTQRLILLQYFTLHLDEHQPEFCVKHAMPHIARQRQTLGLPRKHLLQDTRSLATTRRQPTAKQLVHNRRCIKPVLHPSAARFTFDKDHNRVTPPSFRINACPSC